MSNERDELADVIAHSSMRMASKGVIRYSADGYPVYQADEMAANAVFNAGYRKPAVVTTAEELDALPTFSVILDADGDSAQKDQEGRWWYWAGHRSVETSAILPCGAATVLHRGDA